MQIESIAVPVLVLALLIGAIVLLVLIIWSIKRHRDPHLEIECDAPLGELMQTMAGLTQGEIIGGNAVELLEGSAFFEAMLEEIPSATQTVHFELFLW